MKLNLNKKQMLSIASVMVIGVVLAWLILGTDKHQPAGEGFDPAHAQAVEASPGTPQKGPHGGKLFTQDGYGTEITIFEQGVEPEFRVYTYKDGKPFDPAASKVSITLDRLGRAPQVFTLKQEKDYLKGNAVVEEPHSFKVAIAAQFNNKAYRFSYEQIEARVTMTDQQAEQNGIELLTAGPTRIKSVLQMIGEIRFNEDRLVHVVPRLAGVVESANANAGDRVRKGQVLAVISSPALADLRSELLAAQKRLVLARTTFEREKTLWEEKISAEQDYLQARNAMQEAEIALHSAQQKLASLGGLTSGGNLTRYEIRA
ncbi:MAG: efflux RND transporter periplasmic adaptor subunit, partial [Rugosibacter sp.]|nr:efflux RND transporter periplasmic adaptor subunit [Rugosibacter sp.]